MDHGPGRGAPSRDAPAPYADDAFSAGFDLAGLTVAPAAPVLEAYTAGHVDRAPYAANAVYLHLLRGEAEEALAVFAALPGYKRESRAARTGLAATRAAVATLRGDDAGDSRGIEEAVASEKAGTRRRNGFPGSGPFVLLSLIRDPTPENFARREHLRGQERGVLPAPRRRHPRGARYDHTGLRRRSRLGARAARHRAGRL